MDPVNLELLGEQGDIKGTIFSILIKQVYKFFIRRNPWKSDESLWFLEMGLLEYDIWVTLPDVILETFVVLVIDGYMWNAEEQVLTQDMFYSHLLCKPVCLANVPVAYLLLRFPGIS